MNTQAFLSVLSLDPAACVSLACGGLTLLLAALLFRRFRRPGSRVLCVLASAFVLNAGAITARSKNALSTFLARPHVVHFANDTQSATLREVEQIIRESDGTPKDEDAFASRTTIEALVADDGDLFDSVFSTETPCVYIEGGVCGATSDLQPFFTKYGTRIEAWVRDGGRLLVNAAPDDYGSCQLPFGVALKGGAASAKVGPDLAYLQFFRIPTSLDDCAAIANRKSMSYGSIDLQNVTGWDENGTTMHLWPELAITYDDDQYRVNIAVIAPVDCLGTVMYSTLCAPSSFHMERQYWSENPVVVSDDGSPLWKRLLYWSFREDGFGTRAQTPDSAGDLPISGRFQIQAETIMQDTALIDVHNRSTNTLDVIVDKECNWLEVETPSGGIEPGESLAGGIKVTLGRRARDLPVGVYTGSVVVANSRDFDPDAATRFWTGLDVPLTTPPEYTYPSEQRHWFILTVDDTPPYAGTFRIADGGGLVTEAEGAVARFTVVRESADLPAATIKVRTEDDTARAGVDYAPTWITLDFPEGVATNVVEIPILDNAHLHTCSPATVAPRSFFVRLYSPSNGATLDEAHAAGTVFIAEDELVPHAWFVRPATGGWDDADTDALRALFRSGGSQPDLDAFFEATFESADPDALFGPASDCVFLAFGPSDAEYIDRVLSPWRERIEAWVRAGGRLFLNAMPARGACELPFRLAVDGDSAFDSMRYFIYDSLPMTPTPIMGPSDLLAIYPAQGVPNISSASIILSPEIRDAIRADGGNCWHGNDSGCCPYLLVSEGAGSIAYASYRPPSQLSTTDRDDPSITIASPTIFWQRMLLWAFRPDGFGLVATEDWRPEGVASSTNVVPRSKTYGVLNLGAEDVEVAVSTDVDWLVSESDTAALPAGHQASFRISLAPDALSFPAGSYTGTVSFASSRDFCHEADVGGWGTLTYPAPVFRRTVVFTIRSGDDPDPGPGPGPDPALLPEAPLLSIATYGNSADASSITVTWTGGEGADTFHVYRSATTTRPDAPLRENVASPFVDDDSTLAPGVRYTYWIEAVNEAGSVFGKPDWGNRAVAVSLDAASASVSCAAGTRAVAVSANTAWTVTCDAPWVTLDAEAGDGDATLVVSFAANPDAEARSARIVVTAGGDTPYPRTAAFTLAQAATPPPPPPAPPTFTVAFAPNGGTGKMAAQKVACGKGTALPANAFTRKGYVFLGWAKSKNGAVAYKNKASVKDLAPSGGKAMLYAKWAKKVYKVKFYANAKGVTGKMAVETMTYGSAKRLSANKFKRDGYVFKGWAKSKALAKKGKVAYKNKKSVKNLVTNGKTVKLYAVWKKK